MDAKYYDSPERPFFNKDTIYPDGFAPENYLLSHALQLSSSTSELLKVGCGWSEHSEDLLSEYEKLYSVDSNSKIIDNFRKMTGKFNNVDCSLITDDELPFYEDFFDVVISQRGELLNRRNIFKEVVRVLKPGGHVLATMTGEEDMLELKMEFGRGENFFQDGYTEGIRTKIQDYNHFSGDHLTEETFREFRYKELYRDLQSFTKMLSIFPAIPGFSFDDPGDYQTLTNYMKKHNEDNAIVLNRQVFFWIATKKIR